MSDDQRPPQDIWMDDEALNAHFEAVRTKLRRTSQGNDWEDIPGDQNELTKKIRG